MKSPSETDCHVAEPDELLGKRIVVTEPPGTKELSYIVVVPARSDPSNSLLSVDSPLVRALRGINCGEDFRVQIGRHPRMQILTYRLVRVEDLPLAESSS